MNGKGMGRCYNVRGDGGFVHGRGSGFDMMKHASGAWAGYKAGTKLAGLGVGQWFCDFGFGPLVFF